MFPTCFTSWSSGYRGEILHHPSCHVVKQITMYGSTSSWSCKISFRMDLGHLRRLVRIMMATLSSVIMIIMSTISTSLSLPAHLFCFPPELLHSLVFPHICLSSASSALPRPQSLSPAHRPVAGWVRIKACCFPSLSVWSSVSFRSCVSCSAFTVITSDSCHLRKMLQIFCPMLPT